MFHKNWPKSNTTLSVHKRGTPRLYFETVRTVEPLDHDNGIPFAFEKTQRSCSTKRYKIKFTFICRRLSDIVKIEYRPAKLPFKHYHPFSEKSSKQLRALIC